MDFISTAFYFIVAIFILVTVHELGHFLTAKLFGMRVDKFYIGFDFFDMRLWRRKVGETEYGVGLFPLGGYVKIAGMVDESLDTDFSGSKAEPWEFRAKPAWQRLIVLAGGVVMNMVLAALIFIGVTFTLGETRTSVENPAFVETGSVFDLMGMQTGDRFLEANGQRVENWEEALDPELFTAASLSYTIQRGDDTLTIAAPANIMSRVNENQGFGVRPIMPPVIDKVLVGEPAEAAGMGEGSLITAIDDKPVTDWTEVVGIISANPGTPLTISWLQPAGDGRDTLDAGAIRREGIATRAAVTPGETGKIGIMLRQTIATRRIEVGFAGSVQSGIAQTWKMSAMTVQGFGKIFSGQEDFRKSVGGPIKIARIAGQSAQQGMVSFLYFLAVLSISLAIINMLPVPALDGGQFLLNAIEGVMGREIPFEVKLRIQQVGMAILLSLFAFILFNDLMHP